MEWKIDKFSSWDLRQTNKAAAGSCKTTAAEATLGASSWHWIEHFIEFIENSAATWRRFLTRLSILWRLCVSQSISWLVFVSANLRRSHVQPDQLGTYLHADLIEHQASRVVEETVSLPAELHGVLVHLVQHWEKKNQKKQGQSEWGVGRAGQTSAPASLQDVCRYLWSCRRSRVWKPGWLWIAPPRSPEWETDSCRRKSADWPATPGRSSAGGGSGSEWRRHLKERNEGGMAWAKTTKAWITRRETMQPWMRLLEWMGAGEVEGGGGSGRVTQRRWRSAQYLSAGPAPAAHPQRRWRCSPAPSESHRPSGWSWGLSPKTWLWRLASWTSLRWIAHEKQAEKWGKKFFNQNIQFIWQIMHKFRLRLWGNVFFYNSPSALFDRALLVVPKLTAAFVQC